MMPENLEATIITSSQSSHDSNNSNDKEPIQKEKKTRAKRGPNKKTTKQLEAKIEKRTSIADMFIRKVCP